MTVVFLELGRTLLVYCSILVFIKIIKIKFSSLTGPLLLLEVLWHVLRDILTIYIHEWFILSAANCHSECIIPS